MSNGRFRPLFLVAGLLLISGVLLTGSAAQLQAQGTLPYGTVVSLQGTPHLWFADKQGILHWGGDTRALTGRHINWNYRAEVSLNQLRILPIGDPWLSAGLLKDGDPIYLVKWESHWPQPQLLHIQSIDDVELFGINGSNYGRFVLDRTAWEQRSGIASAGLQRGKLARTAYLPIIRSRAPQQRASPHLRPPRRRFPRVLGPERGWRGITATWREIRGPQQRPLPRLRPPRRWNPGVLGPETAARPGIIAARREIRRHQ